VATDRSQRIVDRSALVAISVIGALAVILTSTYSYLLFHSLAELYSVVIGTSVFVVAWNARKSVRSSHLLIIGTAFLTTSFLDTLHLLAYEGMGVFAAGGSNLPTQLWIAARYLQASSFLLAGLLAKRKVRPSAVLAGSVAAAMLLLTSIFVWKNFPECYIPGVGLTRFKVLSEYIISSLFVASGVLIYRQKDLFEEDVRNLLLGSLALMVGAEMAFTLYVGVYDFSNLVGHLFKIGSYYLAYRAILVTGIKRPFDILFRDLRLSQEALQRTNETLELKVRQRTGELADTIKRLEIEVGERSQAETNLRLSLRRLSALRDIDVAISSSLDPRLTLSVVVAKVVQELDVDAADILAMNQMTQTLEFAAGNGFRTSALQHTNIRIGDGFAGSVARNRRILRIDDLGEDNGRFGRSPEFDKEGFTSYCAVPLVSKGQVQGVLEVFKRDAIDFSDSWQEFLESLARQAVIAIENAALFERLVRSNQDLLYAYDATIEGWSTVLELRDIETEGHTRRVTEMTMRLAREMAYPADQMVHIRRGALLHDIGKLAIPDGILLKPASLTDEEWRIMRQHPVIAREMLGRIDYLRPALDIPYCHHEKWDGTGYPRGLQAEQIPIPARIFSVADVFDALTSDRPYRSAWTKSRALAYIEEQSGRYFEPRVVDVFMLKEADFTRVAAIEPSSALLS
jgi:HD-GYP domain-containing protein (c-di-GMP phosphodiesterase class II)